MKVYAARFGLKPEELDTYPDMKNLFDQFARDCGHEPTESWVLIVFPDGSSRFHPLAEGEERWCCAYAEEIQARMGPAEAVPAPFDRGGARGAAQ